MIKNILALAVIATLGACSSGSDNSTPADQSPTGTPSGTPSGTPGGTPSGTPAAPDAPTGGGAVPAAGTKAGTYIGTFGDSEGVYVINNNNQLAGLAIRANGSAQSLFGDLGAADSFNGELRQYLHQESRPDGASGSFGAVASLVNPLGIDVTIVNGQTIESTAESATAVNLRGAAGSLQVANAASLAGTWSGAHSFCTDGPDGTLIGCQLLTTSLTFNGNTVTGSTVITDAEGTAQAPIFLNGGITEFGEASLIDFNWGDASGYSGVVFFTPSGDGRVAFIGERPVGDPPTISAVMTKQ